MSKEATVEFRKNADALYEELCRRIFSEEYKVGERIPTERELARALGCSCTTVSKAMTRLVHHGLVERRPRAGTRVVKNTVDRTPARMDLDACAFIYPGEQHEVIWQIGQGFQQAAQTTKRRTVMLTTGTDFRKEAEIIGRLSEFDVKGAVVYPVLPEAQDRLYFEQMLRKCPFPVVLADVTLPGVECPAVVSDGFHAGYTMTRYLLEQGLRRIGFLSNYAWVPLVRDRYQGYRRALEEADIEEKPGWVLLEPSMHPDFEHPVERSLPLARHFFENARGLDGMVCYDVSIVSACLTVAREMGIRVPEEFKVMGVNNRETSIQGDLPVARGEPSLPTYRISHQEIGRQAFQMLDRLVKGEKLSTLEVRVRGELVIPGRLVP